MISTFLLLVSVLSAAQAGEYPELRPVDEASQQADFFTFRAHLQAAIARRDATAVLSIVSDEIRNTLGPGDDGIDGFRRLWRPESPDSELWQTLGSTLALGGTFEGHDMFVAPYIFSRWPGPFSAFEHVAIVGARVRVRARPDPNSDTLAVLSFAVVPLARDTRLTADEERQWTSVRLRDGRVGYVASRYARSAANYRAVFSRVGDGWQMVSFIAGD